jgi:hypothetical protein
VFLSQKQTLWKKDLRDPTPNAIKVTSQNTGLKFKRLLVTPNDDFVILIGNTSSRALGYWRVPLGALEDQSAFEKCIKCKGTPLDCKYKDGLKLAVHVVARANSFAMVLVTSNGEACWAVI